MFKKFFPWILVATSLGVNICFRFYTQTMPSLDAAARQEIHGEEMKAVTQMIDKESGSLDSASRARLAKELFRQDLKESGAAIATKISVRVKQLKDRYRDDRGETYMSGIDSYYWLRYLDNLLRTGHVGDRVINGVEYDDLMGGPVDTATRRNVHLGLGWITAKVGGFLFPGLSLTAVLFYLPVVLTVIIALVAFLIARKLGASDLGAFFASFVIHLSPFLMFRSVEEWFDTDIYNVFFPLLAFGSFLFVFSDSLSRVRRLMFCFLSGFFVACYASTWKGWWFIFDVMVVSGLLFIWNQKLSQEEEKTPGALIRSQLLWLVCFCGLTSAMVVGFCGFSVWNDFVSEPLHLVRILDITRASVWPNVFLTVAELGSLNALDVVHGCGGEFVFFGALMGLLYIFTVEHGMRDNKRGFGFLVLVLWIATTFYAAREASRFTLLLVVPAGLGFGLFVTKVYEKIYGWSRGWTNRVRAKAVNAAVIVVFSLQIVFQVTMVHAGLVSARPLVDDIWYRSLAWIKTNTPKEAVINSWWDFGHWFKAMAARRVLFDGMTQNTPVAYWIAQVLLTADERYAANTLRMINAHANSAAEALMAKGGFDAAQAVAILKGVLQKDSPAALADLMKRLPGPLAHEVHGYIFGSSAPSAYFILSYDMVDKVGPISFIGNWGFEKVDLWFKSRELKRGEFIAYVQKRLGLTSEAAQLKYLEVISLNEKSSRAWFSDIYGYYSWLAPSREWEGLRVFDNSLVMFPGNKSATIASDISDRKGAPQSVVFMENGEMKEAVQKSPAVKFSAVLVDKKGVANSLFVTPALAKSLLLRLYFFKGEGLKYFKLVHQEVDEDDKAITIYKLEWPE